MDVSVRPPTPAGKGSFRVRWTRPGWGRSPVLEEGEVPGLRDGEGRALVGGDGLRRRQLDPQRVHVLPVQAHPVVEMGPGGEAGLAHRADPLALAHALSLAHRDPGQVAVERLVPVGVADAGRSGRSPPDQPARVTTPSRGGHDRGPLGGRVVDAEVRAPHLEDGVEAAAAEAGGDPREAQRRAQEGLAERGAVPVVVARSLRALVAHCAQRPVAALEARGEDAPVAHEPPVEGELLHRHPERVAGLDLGVEVDVPGEDLGEVEGELGVLAGVGDGREEARLDLARDDRGAGVVRAGEDLGLADPRRGGSPAASAARRSRR